MSSMDLTPIYHAFVAALAQVFIGSLCGHWGVGALPGCIWFIAREHTQAEYRWIAEFGNGKRSSMPWWGGFDPKVWNTASLLDWLVPFLTCSSVYFVISF